MSLSETIGTTETNFGTCPTCGMGCQLLADVANGEPVRVKADKNSPLGPSGCPRFGPALDYHIHPDRLNYPMKRVGERGEGKWERISWEQALDEIAAKLAQIRDEFGPEAVLAPGGSAHGAGDAATWRWCNLWGTPNYFHQGKNCAEPEFLAEWAMYGDIGAPVNIPSPASKCVIVWGASVKTSMGGGPWKMLLDGKKQGMKLIVIDPRLTETAKEADLWLRLRPGTDGALAYGMLNVLISEDLYDHEFVQDWCTGFDELKALVAKYPLDRVERITWVPADKIAEAARLFATAKPSLITWGLGTAHSGKATLSAVMGKCFLRAITGGLDVPGGEMLIDVPSFMAHMDEMYWDKLIDHPLRTRDNVSAEDWPIASVRGLKTFREAMAKVYPKGVGPQQYMVYPAPSRCWSAILEQKPYPIKAVIVQTGNHIVSMANGRQVYDAFKSPNLDLLVAMEHWETPTTRLADYVLPATDALERDNIWSIAINGWGNNVTGTPAAVDPLHERRDDYQLWRELGNRLGQEGYWPDTQEGWFDRLLRPAGVGFRDLVTREVPWLVPEQKTQRYKERGFATFSGKVELAPSIFRKLGVDAMPEYQEPEWSPISTPELAKDFPLVLTTMTSSQAYYRSQQRQLRKMRKIHPWPRIEMHPDTAAELGIGNGQWVYVETPLGRVRQQAQFSTAIDPRVVAADPHWWYPEEGAAEPGLFGVWESNLNSILPNDDAHCDYAGDNQFRGLLCRVYPAETLETRLVL